MSEADKVLPDTQTINLPLLVNESAVYAPTIQAFDPLPDEHPCYRWVGLIAAETARIERLLDQAICNVAEIDFRLGACFTGQMVGPAPRSNALYQLASHAFLGDGWLSRILVIGDQAGKTFALRNRAVHDPWLQERQSGTPHQFRGKPKMKPDFGAYPVPEEDLRSSLTALRELRHAVKELVSDLWTAMRKRRGE